MKGQLINQTTLATRVREADDDGLLPDFLLELLDGPLVDAVAMVDEMAGDGGLAGIDVADDHDVDMSLVLAHCEFENDLDSCETDFESIPKNIIEAAHLDGAGSIQRMMKINLPSCKNIILFSAIYLFVDAFAMFAGSYRLLGASGGTDNAGLLLVTYIYQTKSVYHQFNVATAISMSIVPILMLLVWFILLRPKKEQLGKEKLVEQKL